jgi:hypothetical protein
MPLELCLSLVAFIELKVINGAILHVCECVLRDCV